MAWRNHPKVGYGNGNRYNSGHNQTEKMVAEPIHKPSPDTFRAQVREGIKQQKNITILEHEGKKYAVLFGLKQEEGEKEGFLVLGEIEKEMSYGLVSISNQNYPAEGKQFAVATSPSGEQYVLLNDKEVSAMELEMKFNSELKAGGKYALAKFLDEDSQEKLAIGLYNSHDFFDGKDYDVLVGIPALREKPKLASAGKESSQAVTELPALDARFLCKGLDMHAICEKSETDWLLLGEVVGAQVFHKSVLKVDFSEGEFIMGIREERVNTGYARRTVQKLYPLKNWREVDAFIESVQAANKDNRSPIFEMSFYVIRPYDSEDANKYAGQMFRERNDMSRNVFSTSSRQISDVTAIIVGNLIANHCKLEPVAKKQEEKPTSYVLDISSPMEETISKSEPKTAAAQVILPFQDGIFKVVHLSRSTDYNGDYAVQLIPETSQFVVLGKMVSRTQRHFSVFEHTWADEERHGAGIAYHPLSNKFIILPTKEKHEEFEKMFSMDSYKDFNYHIYTKYGYKKSSYIGLMLSMEHGAELSGYRVAEENSGAYINARNAQFPNGSPEYFSRSAFLQRRHASGSRFQNFFFSPGVLPASRAMDNAVQGGITINTLEWHGDISSLPTGSNNANYLVATDEDNGRFRIAGAELGSYYGWSAVRNPHHWADSSRDQLGILEYEISGGKKAFRVLSSEVEHIAFIAQGENISNNSVYYVVAPFSAKEELLEEGRLRLHNNQFFMGHSIGQPIAVKN